MATTLAEIAAVHPNKLVQGFINELIVDNYLLGALTFDDCLAPNGISNLTYSYNRVTTHAQAKFRDLNAEPDKSDAKMTQVTTNVAILSDAFDIDRVARQAADDIYQMKLEELKFSIIRGFNHAFINGDKAKTSDKTSSGFDGLSKILKGTSTEVTSAVDLSTVTKEAALAFSEELDGMTSKLFRKPDVLLCGSAMKTKINAVCRVLGLATTTPDAVGNQVSTWNGIVIQEQKDGSIANDDIYAACLGMDSVHGITLAGGNAIDVHLPDWTQPGAVKSVDADFVCGLAVRKTLGAGVLRAHTA